MRKSILLVLCLLLAWGTAGCGGGASANDENWNDFTFYVKGAKAKLPMSGEALDKLMSGKGYKLVGQSINEKNVGAGKETSVYYEDHDNDVTVKFLAENRSGQSVFLKDCNVVAIAVTDGDTRDIRFTSKKLYPGQTMTKDTMTKNFGEPRFDYDYSDEGEREYGYHRYDTGMYICALMVRTKDEVIQRIELHWWIPQN